MPSVRDIAIRHRRLGALLPGAAERDETALDELIAERTAVSRPNTIAVLSPKGGVGKTTCTFLLGNLLASAAGLRCVAVDGDPDFGTLGSLAPKASRAPGSVADVLARMSEIDSVAELKPLVSSLPSGLDMVTAPPQAEVMSITPELCALLIEFLSRFYDVILLDLGTGIAGPVARFALEEADQSMVVSTPDFVCASTVLGALRHLRGERLTVVLNQAPRLPSVSARQEIEDQLRRQRIHRHVVVPYDDRLRAMLDSAAYEPAALGRDTRMSIKRLGLTAAGWLV